MAEFYAILRPHAMLEVIHRTSCNILDLLRDTDGSSFSPSGVKVVREHLLSLDLLDHQFIFQKIVMNGRTPTPISGHSKDATDECNKSLDITLVGLLPIFHCGSHIFHFRRREFSTLVISTDKLGRLGNPELRRNLWQVQRFVENPGFDL